MASERIRLGLTQSQLAARMHTSRSSVARIEQGQLPAAETMRQLSLALLPNRPVGPVRRLAGWVTARSRLGLRQGSRLFWSGLLLLLLLLVLISVLVVLNGRSSDMGPAPASHQPTIAASDAPGVPAATHRARVKAKKAAATPGKARANRVYRGIPTASHRVREPVSPSTGGGSGGGGGGGSGGPGPGLAGHGVGSHGGNAPQGAAPAPAESGGGSTPTKPPSCVLPGVLC